MELATLALQAANVAGHAYLFFRYIVRVQSKVCLTNSVVAGNLTLFYLSAFIVKSCMAALTGVYEEVFWLILVIKPLMFIATMATGSLYSSSLAKSEILFNVPFLFLLRTATAKQ